MAGKSDFLGSHTFSADTTKTYDLSGGDYTRVFYTASVTNLDGGARITVYRAVSEGGSYAQASTFVMSGGTGPHHSEVIDVRGAGSIRFKAGALNGIDELLNIEVNAWS